VPTTARHLSLSWSISSPCPPLYFSNINFNPCNENQLNALFIFSLFRQSTSTCFGHICSPPSRGILYIYNNWHLLCWKEVCLKLLKRIYIYIYIYIYHHNFKQPPFQHKYKLLYMYSIPPDDGLQIWPKHVEVDWRNKLRINTNSTLSLVSLHICIEMHGQQNIKCISIFFLPSTPRSSKWYLSLRLYQFKPCMLLSYPPYQPHIIYVQHWYTKWETEIMLL